MKGYKEQEDLMMLHSSTQSHNGHDEEKQSNSNDSTHHLETRDQSEPFAPCCTTNHQKTDHLKTRTDGWLHFKECTRSEKVIMNISIKIHSHQVFQFRAQFDELTYYFHCYGNE